MWTAMTSWAILSLLNGLGSSSPGGLFLGALPAGELLVDGGHVGLLCAAFLGLMAGVAGGRAVSRWSFRNSSAMLLWAPMGVLTDGGEVVAYRGPGAVANPTSSVVITILRGVDRVHERTDASNY